MPRTSLTVGLDEKRQNSTGELFGAAESRAESRCASEISGKTTQYHVASASLELKQLCSVSCALVLMT